MAKEDLLLREEMGRLEIEPVKIKRSRSDENPFLKHSKRGLSRKPPVQSTSCNCALHKKNTINGICKRKQNRVLKEPVLEILKSRLVHSEVKKEDCQYDDTSTSEYQHVNIDHTLNLCTLVKNCNQLKISCGSNEQSTSKSEDDTTKWWKNDTVSTRENKKQPPSNQTGSCSQQALNPPCDVTIDELASYFETLVHIPKKMSSMAEMMYI